MFGGIAPTTSAAQPASPFGAAPGATTAFGAPGAQPGANAFAGFGATGSAQAGSPFGAAQTPNPNVFGGAQPQLGAAAGPAAPAGSGSRVVPYQPTTETESSQQGAQSTCKLHHISAMNPTYSALPVLVHLYGERKDKAFFSFLFEVVRL